MAPQTPPEPPRCCCFNVKTTTVALGIFHMVMSVLLLIEYSLEVANGKGFCKDLDKDYYRIAPFGSFQVLFGIEITGISTFPPQKKERFLIPFLALQIIDFLLSLLTMFSSYIRVPAVISVSSLGHTGSSKVPVLALQLLDFCLSILTLCSSYMEVPSYLSLRPADTGVGVNSSFSLLAAPNNPLLCREASLSPLEHPELLTLTTKRVFHVLLADSSCVPKRDPSFSLGGT
uniref:Uncharacterized protein n=1 Tax=Malurus cyaneus samueli TaxID=2593467 RepID=A0A8C5UD87_9PASS